MSNERESKMMRAPEAAKLLGTSETSMYAAIQRNEIPGVVRFGRSVRINRQRFMEWLRGSDPDETAAAE